MKIGYLQSPDERVPFSDLSIKKLEKDGHLILLDEAFEIEDSLQNYSAPTTKVLQQADVLVSLFPVEVDLLNQLKPSQHYLSFFKPYEPTYNAKVLQNCVAQCYSLDMIPRSTLAQSMDALSSMASIAGYQAVLLAAAKLPRYFPMLMTAAGTIRPAKVLILGAGVAGLQAIAVARKLGAKVEVFDVRLAVKEEVESLGAKFVMVDGSADDSAAGGYAIQQTDDYKAKQKQAIADAVKNADVVITTAQLRGKTAPILVDEAMVDSMQKGSVIIDLAASTGGNCACTENDAEVNYKGITVIGNSNLHLGCVQDASTLVANNIYSYLKLFEQGEDGNIGNEHEILQASKIHPK